MQKFMILLFNRKGSQLKLEAWLDEQQEAGNYAAPDMSQFYYIHDGNGIFLVDCANMDLGRQLKDMGYAVRHQQWRDL